MTTRRDPERDLDELLQDGGDLGNLYRRLPRYEPPRRLDRAVLGEAARAVRSGKPPRRQRWMFGVGSAAGLVLAAGIAWRIGHDAMNQEPAMSGHAAKPVPSVVPVQPISDAARAKHEESESQPAPAAAPPPPAAKAAAESARRQVQNEAKPRPPAKPRAQAQDELMERAPPPAAPPPPPAAPETAPVTTEAFPRLSTPPTDTSAGAAGGMMKHRTSAPASVAEPDERDAASRAQPFATPSTSVELRRDTQLAPQDWLAHIHQLMRQGRRQQAAESLRLFHRAHPDWEIPDDLRPLLD